MAVNAFQQDYNLRQGIAQIGDDGPPGFPCAKQPMQIHVPTSGTKPKHGHGVVWDKSENGMRYPVTDADELAIGGIISTKRNKSADKDGNVSYENEELAEVVIEGYVYVKFGTAAEFGDTMRFDKDDGDWEAFDPTTSTQLTAANFDTQLPSCVVSCANPIPVAAGGIGLVKISSARSQANVA